MCVCKEDVESDRESFSIYMYSNIGFLMSLYVAGFCFTFSDFALALPIMVANPLLLFIKAHYVDRMVLTRSK